MIGNSELRLLSPAKLNLFLHIVGRRVDGYHLLQSVFQLLDFGDDMRFVRRDDGHIVLHDKLAGVDDTHHLAVRAATLLQQQTRSTFGADIYIHKRIPMGGGLGGGSSNAATSLLALNQLWNCQQSLDTLAAWGLTLGADVPIFVRGETAFAEGVGEQLTRFPVDEKWFVVLTPNVAVSTAYVFTHPKLTRDHAIVTIRALADMGWSTSTTNDCETLVRSEYPEVDRALKRLTKFAPARMTGTGSSVFAWVSSQIEAEQILQACNDEFSGFVARGVNVSPTHLGLR
jgi:4-diphosphocytidyl-2-C-methyl-D-erythritol kinase